MLLERGYIILQVMNDCLVKELEAYHDLDTQYIQRLDALGRIQWVEYAKHGSGAKVTQAAEHIHHKLTYHLFKHGPTRYDISISGGGVDRYMRRLLNEEIEPIISNHLKHITSRKKYVSGILPVTGTEQAGIWHRDAYDLFNDPPPSSLPPWYITCLLWLNDDSDIPTEIIAGSHLDPRSVVDITTSAQIVTITPKAGQVLIMDGRLVHRGGVGTTDSAIRKMAYMTIHPFWYDEPTCSSTGD